jgi:transposase
VSPAREAAGEAAMAPLSRSCLHGLGALQRIQELYDAEMWDMDGPTHAKVRHIHIHLSKTVGRLASLIEAADHDDFHGRYSGGSDNQEVANLIADMLMHAAQLADAYDVDLPSALATRYRSNARRFAPESRFASFGSADQVP